MEDVSEKSPGRHRLTVTRMSRCAMQLPHILQLWQISTDARPISEDKQTLQPIATRVFSLRYRLYITYVSLSQSAAKVSRLPTGDGFPSEV